MTAEIITIGNELLIGQVVDSNSADIAGELDRIGISVDQIISIKDDRAHILKTLTEAAARVNVVIISGGLGPTKDDVTKYSLCEFFNDTLITNEAVLNHIEELFKKLNNRPVSHLNKEQAMVPSKATVLPNKYGTAPGLWMKQADTVIIAIPGVPFEMKMLMEREIIPKLKGEFKRPFIYHKTLRTYGLGESDLAELIEDWENNLPGELQLAYLPDLGSVLLRISGKGDDENAMKMAVENQLNKLYPLIEDFLLETINEDDNITVTLNKLLTSKGQFLCAAESFSGGEVAAKFTINPGSSTCFKGGIVTYATQTKVELLHISPEIIKKYTVVSGEVAEAMASNALKLFKADYAISTTGNAGPKKGESEAEVGTVFIGIATPSKVFSKRYFFGNSREDVVKKAVNQAFELLLRELIKK